ncbi:hypothetical protein FRC11_008094 [Ceratobasidium sp. 423]|nr:hypothetical protein FRC11_008094 [Ceratobasidium sp. 423]
MRDEAKQEFHNMVGPQVHEPMPVKASNRNPNPPINLLTPPYTPEPAITEPAITEPAITEPAIAGPSGATSSPPADGSPGQPQSLADSGSVPVYSLSDFKSTLRSVVGMIPTSSLQDLEDITKVLNGWTKKKSTLQVHRNDVHIQVRTLQDVFTRHLNVFVAISQSEGTATMNRELADLQAKLSTIQGHAPRASSSSSSTNIEQVEPGVLQETVRQKTGHTPDSAYILSGKISYREAVAMNQGLTFDVYEGKLKDEEAVAIKLFRKSLKNDGEGVHFVRRIMRQVQLWSSFSSPFVLECRGVGMQMTTSKKGEEYERFQFYLVSPLMRRGNAVQFIKGLKMKGAYVNILKCLRDAALGIQHLHHRDPPCVHASIRGENVLIKDDGTACLNGFGLTKALTLGNLIELTGDLVQFRWMAPELFQSNPLLNPSCDIWAWAMTALELITGQEPYYQLEQMRSWTFNDRIVKEGKLPQRSDYPTFERYSPQPDLMWGLLEKCWASASERPTIDKVIEELDNIEKAQIEQQTAPHNWA